MHEHARVSILGTSTALESNVVVKVKVKHDNCVGVVDLMELWGIA